MNGSAYEPRTAIWAVAEVCWQDDAGIRCVAAATIEDTSPSGACLRLKRPVSVGSRLSVKWHRGQFAAVARNCRQDGREFLLGVRREKFAAHDPAARAMEPVGLPAKPKVVAASKVAENPPRIAPVQRTRTLLPSSRELLRNPEPGNTIARTSRPARHISPQQERNAMEPKNMFPKFWRREPANPVTENPIAAPTPASKTTGPLPEPPTGRNGALLSYDDIYGAAGILQPRSAYDIKKVSEMLHSERISGLSDDMRRASVLMAIEAAGASADDLLRDANERQQALETYEGNQRRQLEQFETRKALENAQLEAEMARVAAHYAERIKANLEQVASEKEALRNWEMAKQHESHRITEVIELCTKPAETQAALAASAGAPGGTATARGTSGPSLVSGMGSGKSN